MTGIYLISVTVEFNFSASAILPIARFPNSLFSRLEGSDEEQQRVSELL
jgi:hypothetical protein